MYGKVIDVSKFQKEVNFDEVKKAGYKGAILRIGYRGYGKSGTIVLDPYFTTNVEKCKKVGLPFGVYFFSQAITKSEAIEEAIFTINNLVLMDAVPDFPVYIDTEYSTHPLHNGRADNLSKDVRTDVVKAFCEFMENKGYYTGIYASTDWLNTKLNMSVLKDYDVWVAHYASKCGYKGKYGMWQFTSKATIPGVKGNCDCSYCYHNYPNIIQSKRLNGHIVPVKLFNISIKGVTDGDKKTIMNLAQSLELTCIAMEAE